MYSWSIDVALTHTAAAVPRDIGVFRISHYIHLSRATHIHKHTLSHTHSHTYLREYCVQRECYSMDRIGPILRLSGGGGGGSGGGGDVEPQTPCRVQKQVLNKQEINIKKKNKNNNEKENITHIIPVPWVFLRTRLFHLCRRGRTEWIETPYLPSPKYIRI